MQTLRCKYTKGLKGTSYKLTCTALLTYNIGSNLLALLYVSWKIYNHAFIEISKTLQCV